MCGRSSANAGRSTSTKPTSSAPAARHNCRSQAASSGWDAFCGTALCRCAATVGCSLSDVLIKSGQPGFFANDPVEYAGRSKTTQSAQKNALADGITQPGRFYGCSEVDRFRHEQSFISVFDAFLNCLPHPLSLSGILFECRLGGLLVLADFAFGVSRFDEHSAHAKFPHFVIQRPSVSFHRMFARSVDSHVRCGNKSDHRTDVDDPTIARLPHPWQNGVRHPQHAEEIGFKLMPSLLDTCFFQRTRERITSVVDQ